MNREVHRLAAEFVLELSKATPEDYLQTKLMMLSSVRLPGTRYFFTESVLTGRGKKTIIA